MKRLSLYLFLILFTLQTPSWADDIRDFQIEGISIGDSALDHFTEEQIQKNKKDYYKDKTYTPVEMNQLSFFKVYDAVDIQYKTNDKNFKIRGISGAMLYKYNISDCYAKMDSVVNEISNLFKNKKFLNDKGKHVVDKSGKSKYDMNYFYFKNGDYLTVVCYDYSAETNHVDHLSITLATKAFQKFLETKAYK